MQRDQETIEKLWWRYFDSGRAQRNEKAAPYRQVEAGIIDLLVFLTQTFAQQVVTGQRLLLLGERLRCDLDAPYPD